jgi:hypothetical protein
MLFRYGNDPDGATRGYWWIDLQQRTRLINWATLHQIPVPSAVRIMSAVMHVWSGPGNYKSTMEYAARAVTKRPLISYEGESKPQINESGSRVAGYIAPAPLDPPFTQLCIPGLNEDLVCRDALSFESIIAVEPGASALFGDDQLVPFGGEGH